MATHAPLLMACPDADLFILNHHGVIPARFDQTEHFQMMSKFHKDPDTFLERHLSD